MGNFTDTRRFISLPYGRRLALFGLEPLRCWRRRARRADLTNVSPLDIADSWTGLASMANYHMLDFIAFFRSQLSVNSTWLFPALLLALNVGAALMSFKGGNWRQGAYWLASAVCVAMVASK